MPVISGVADAPITPAARFDSNGMTVILNAEAGPESNSAADIRANLGDAFDEAGVRADIVEVHGSDRLVGVLRKALPEADGTVVAAGGDGTVSAVAAHVAGTNKILGVLPLGTLNHFARDIGIPLQLRTAVRILAKGHTKAVDAAEVNGRVFVNNSSLGIYPRLIAQRDNLQHQRNHGKWAAFAWATVLAFRRFPFLHLRICFQGRELRRKTAFLFVGNNDYEMTGLSIGARRRLDAGNLGLYTTHRTGRLGLLRLGVSALLGRVDQARDFGAFAVDEALIDSPHKRLLVSMDGEVTYMQLPLHYRSRPGALRVIVPVEA
jgi:diacylglycerol kinase family enzyme